MCAEQPQCQRQSPSLLPLWIIGLLALALAWQLRPAPRLPAGDTITEPFEGVRQVHRVADFPRRMDMNIVLIDLRNPRIRCEVAAITDHKPGEDHRETTRHCVRRLGAQIGINGGFFDSRGNLTSLSTSKGQPISPWHPTEKNHNYGVNIGPDNTVTFITPLPGDASGYSTQPRVALYNALSGNDRLLRDGKITARKGSDPNYPQTALGLTRDNRLILFVSDGRQPEISGGMTYEEVARVLQEFGAVDAIALDGGGSATLVMSNKNGGSPRVVNHPSDGRERPVGNSLVVFATQQ